MNEDGVRVVSIDDVPNLPPGTITAHCSEEDGPADVGMSVTLPGGGVLWAGEISLDAWKKAGEAAAHLGDDCGTWLILYSADGQREAIIGKTTTQEAGFALIRAVSHAIMSSPAENTERAA